MKYRKLTNKLKALIDKDPIVLADIGAAGGIHERWRGLGAGLKIMGFEPDQRAFSELKSSKQAIWINAALAEHEGNATLLITRHQTNTSLLRPNRTVVDSIYQNPADFDIVKEVVVPCTTLDLASEQSGVFPAAIKIDTQGTELSILKGGLKCIERSLLVIELEVEFIELYQDQPLFGEVDAFLRKQGFILFDLGNLLMLKRGRYMFPRERKGQLVAADALYFRSPDSLVNLISNLSGESKRLAIIAQYCAVCTVYGYGNLAFEALQNLHQHKFIHTELFAQLCAAISYPGKVSREVFLPGQGRLHKWLMSLVTKLEPRQNSIWINDLGNE